MEKRLPKIVLCAAALVSLAIGARAQEPQSIYFMHQLPVANRHNPAAQHTYLAYVGGAAIPVVGQILPPLDLHIGLNNFKYSDFVLQPGGPFADSLALVIHDDGLARRLFDRMAANSPVFGFDINANVDLLRVGFRTGNVFWNISLTERVESRASLPVGLLQLPYYGNVNFPGGVVPLSGTELQATHYREAAVGAAVKVTDFLSVGATAKLLMGLANVNTAKSGLSWETDPVNYAMMFRTNFEFNASLPFVAIDKLGYDAQTEGFEFDVASRDFDPAGYMLAMGNKGLGADFGMVYQPSNKLAVHASVTDLGAIRWNENVVNIRSRGHFAFEGLDINSYVTDTAGFLEQMLDSVLSMAEITTSRQSYTTATPMNIYAGGSYSPLKWLKFTALYRGRYAYSELRSSFTGGMVLGRDKSGLSVSYTYRADAPVNVGVGLVIQMGVWQTFLATDNALAFFQPQHGRDFGIRFGSNLIFGRSRDSRTSLLEY